MSNIHYIFDEFPKVDLPQQFVGLFTVNHPLQKKAAEYLQINYLSDLDKICQFEREGHGMMFGALVVRDANGRVGALFSFSGDLLIEQDVKTFVPPLFNQEELSNTVQAYDAVLHELNKKRVEIESSIENDKKLIHKYENERDDQLRELKKHLSQRKKERRSQREKEILDEKSMFQLSIESQHDRKKLTDLKVLWKTKISRIEADLNHLEQKLDTIEKQRQEKNHAFKVEKYSAYLMSNSRGEKKTVAAQVGNKGFLPGIGDCASTRLLSYANQFDYKPLAITEFWWGAMPEDEVRNHGSLYPPCRGRCHVLMEHMLSGFEVEQKPKLVVPFDDDYPEILYEDQDLVVVNKPAGMLSVPGKETEDSVLIRMKERYPDVQGPLLVHRLDMSTSGLILVAKNNETHRHLQRQFAKRLIEKRYVAMLSKAPDGTSGIVDLPLRVDLNDRPRQLVCDQYGKPSTTRWQLLGVERGRVRVHFFPETGRTHQIRVHAAHCRGLDSPIVGDELYGTADKRLYLHAEQLTFLHPSTGKTIKIESSAPF